MAWFSHRLLIQNRFSGIITACGKVQRLLSRFCPYGGIMNIKPPTAVLAALIAISFSCDAFASGPWVQKQDKVQVSITAAYSFYDKYVDPDGDSIDFGGDVAQYELFYYYNLGLKNNSDISVTVGLLESQAQEPEDRVLKRTIQGLSDTSVRYRRQIYDKHAALALVGGLVFPGSYDQNFINSPGVRKTAIEAGFSAGAFYRERALYGSLDAVTRVYFDAEDELLINAEIGRVFDQNWLLRGLASWFYRPSSYNIYDTPAFGGTANYSDIKDHHYEYGFGITHLHGSKSSIGLTFLTTQQSPNTKKDKTISFTYAFQTR